MTISPAANGIGILWSNSTRTPGFSVDRVTFTNKVCESNSKYMFDKRVQLDFYQVNHDKHFNPVCNLRFMKQWDNRRVLFPQDASLKESAYWRALESLHLKTFNSPKLFSHCRLQQKLKGIFSNDDGQIVYTRGKTTRT